MELSDGELGVLEEIYPYQRDSSVHPLACLFFNGPVKFELEAAEAWARHIFDRLDCSPPRSPSVKYDAQGGLGAPWESGVWIDADAERMKVHVSVQDKPVADMDDVELAALRRDLDAVEAARRADTLGGA